MNELFIPLFTRLRQKYAPFPVSCGITIENGREEACFSRAREKLLLFSRDNSGDELLSFVTKPHPPDVLCIAAAPELRDSKMITPAIRSMREDGIPVVFTDTAAVCNALGVAGREEGELTALLDAAGFIRRPAAGSCPFAALVALTGYYFMNKEYEVIDRNVVPLLLEGHPLFSFLRRIPYGEVVTYGDVAKELGLQWNEEELMRELTSLPFGADVPGHRVVGRDGRLSGLFPGGKHTQRERLKWELVPFSGPDRVDLQQAKWSRHKYRRLTNYLTHIASEARFLEMRFEELESIIGQALPKAARRLGSWWRDEREYAAIWHDAGWSIADVNLQQETVTFVRMN